jgi:hypothetical protein
MHVATATNGGACSLAQTKESPMSISLGTVSEMTKGWDFPMINPDNPAIKPLTFYNVQF